MTLWRGTPFLPCLCFDYKRKPFLKKTKVPYLSFPTSS